MRRLRVGRGEKGGSVVGREVRENNCGGCGKGRRENDRGRAGRGVMRAWNKNNRVAEDGFDPFGQGLRSPPTLGLWALCASSAPRQSCELCWQFAFYSSENYVPNKII